MGIGIRSEAAVPVLSAFLAFGILGVLPIRAAAADADAPSISTDTAPSGLAEDKQAALRLSMRRLWADHVIWTREYIVASLAGGADAGDVSSRLLRNQTDIGDAFAVYYGKEAGASLSALLKQHILIAADVVAGAKAGNAAKFRDADQRWHKNAGDIAVFLSGINPGWSKNEIAGMFNDHLALTAKETTSRLGKAWVDDISAFDEMFGQMMLMADRFSGGIVKQFPEKF